MSRTIKVILAIVTVFALVMVIWASFLYGKQTANDEIEARDKNIFSLRQQLFDSVPRSDYDTIKSDYTNLSKEYDKLYDGALKAIEIASADQYIPQRYSTNCTTNTVGSTTYTNCY